MNTPNEDDLLKNKISAEQIVAAKKLQGAMKHDDEVCNDSGMEHSRYAHCKNVHNKGLHRDDAYNKCKHIEDIQKEHVHKCVSHGSEDYKNDNHKSHMHKVHLNNNNAHKEDKYKEQWLKHNPHKEGMYNKHMHDKETKQGSDVQSGAVEKSIGTELRNKNVKIKGVMRKRRQNKNQKKMDGETAQDASFKTISIVDESNSSLDESMKMYGAVCVKGCKKSCIDVCDEGSTESAVLKTGKEQEFVKENECIKKKEHFEVKKDINTIMCNALDVVAVQNEQCVHGNKDGETEYKNLSLSDNQNHPAILLEVNKEANNDNIDVSKHEMLPSNTRCDESDMDDLKANTNKVLSLDNNNIMHKDLASDNEETPVKVENVMVNNIIIQKDLALDDEETTTNTGAQLESNTTMLNDTPAVDKNINEDVLSTHSSAVPLCTNDESFEPSCSKEVPPSLGDVTIHGRADTSFEEYTPDKRYARLSILLGHGSQKLVYKAIDTYEAHEVAWNVISLSHCPSHFLDEITLLKSINHPHIIKLKDYYVFNNNLVFITELMTSGTLRGYLKTVKPTPRIIRSWSLQILAALSHLHSNSMIHRDIKCENIFINGSSGQVKIGDLGIAKKCAQRRYTIVGTPEFMAREVFEGDGYGESVDVYAFGMALLEMSTGEYPYSECTNTRDVFKRIMVGIPPKALYKIRNACLRRVVVGCLSGESERFSLKECMDHHFFVSDDDALTDKDIVCTGIEPETDGLTDEGLMINNLENCDLTNEEAMVNQPEGESLTVMSPINTAADEKIAIRSTTAPKSEFISGCKDCLCFFKTFTFPNTLPLNTTSLNLISFKENILNLQLYYKERDRFIKFDYDITKDTVESVVQEMIQEKVFKREKESWIRNVMERGMEEIREKIQAEEIDNEVMRKWIGEIVKKDLCKDMGDSTDVHHNKDSSNTVNKEYDTTKDECINNTKETSPTISKPDKEDSHVDDGLPVNTTKEEILGAGKEIHANHVEKGDLPTIRKEDCNTSVTDKEDLPTIYKEGCVTTFTDKEGSTADTKVFAIGENQDSELNCTVKAGLQCNTTHDSISINENNINEITLESANNKSPVSACGNNCGGIVSIKNVTDIVNSTEINTNHGTNIVATNNNINSADVTNTFEKVDLHNGSPILNTHPNLTLDILPPSSHNIPAQVIKPESLTPTFNDFDFTHSPFPDTTSISEFVQQTAIVTRRDSETCQSWIKTLTINEIETIGELKILTDEDWDDLSLTVFSSRAMKNMLYGRDKHPMREKEMTGNNFLPINDETTIKDFIACLTRFIGRCECLPDGRTLSKCSTTNGNTSNGSINFANINNGRINNGCANNECITNGSTINGHIKNGRVNTCVNNGFTNNECLKSGSSNNDGINNGYIKNNSTDSANVNNGDTGSSSDHNIACPNNGNYSNGENASRIEPNVFTANGEPSSEKSPTKNDGSSKDTLSTSKDVCGTCINTAKHCPCINNNYCIYGPSEDKCNKCINSEWASKLLMQDVRNVGELKSLTESDWERLELSVFARRIIKNAVMRKGKMVRHGRVI